MQLEQENEIRNELGDNKFLDESIILTGVV
jgi:hypothetical protein